MDCSQKVTENKTWEQLCVYLIGPYIIRRKENLHCRAVTMLDPATGWFEVHETKVNACSDEVANTVENNG